MNLTFLGGAQEVGASCVLLELGGKRIVFDCGMRMGGIKDPMPELRLIQEAVGGVDAIFLSHAHMDHSGFLPVLSEAYPLARIFCTVATKDLVKVLLQDSLKIVDSREGEIPVFSEQQVENTLERMLCFNPNYTFKPFNDHEMQVTFYSAGHIAGAVGIYVTTSEGTVFYTGDFSLTRQSTVEGASIPKLRPDVVICESTYGDKLHANRELEEKRLADAVGKIIEQGGKVLIPSFALGRAQDILLILKRAMAKKQLEPCKVYVDGMVKDICTIYERHPNYLRSQLGKKILKGNSIFFDDWIQKVTDKEMRERIATDATPCCIVASSGMLTGGASQFYAPYIMSDEKNLVAITGYQDEESPGRKLLELVEAPEGEKTLTLGTKKIQVACQIQRFGLSAHADQTEIIALVNSLTPPYTFMVHGNQEVTYAIGEKMQSEVGGRVYVPENGESFKINLQKVRKQRIVQQIPCMGEKQVLTERELEHLWQFVIERIGTQKGLVVEELYTVWYGNQAYTEEDLKTLNDWLLKSPYFENEMKRPFIYHAVAPELLPTVDPEEPMEVNAMLKKVDEYFTSEMGLYKKGARFNEKIVLLSFHFPEQAKKAYATQFKAFTAETKWEVEVNNSINLNYAQTLIQMYLQEVGITTGQISYFAHENAFRVKIVDAKEAKEIKEIEERFLQQTGVKLEVLDLQQHTTPQTIVHAKRPDALEQNKAMWYVDQTFAITPHKLYKKSVKQVGGVAVIELSFITPQVGAYYKQEIESLKEVTGWDFVINPMTNQNELQNMIRNLTFSYGVIPSKISYMPMTQSVQVKGVHLDEQVQEIIEKKFFEMAGISVSFVK